MKILHLLLALSLAIPAFAQKEALQRSVGTNTVTGSLSSAPFQVATIAALKAVTVAGNATPNGTQCYVTGYYATGDSGGGYFTYNSASAAADNGGTVIQPTSGSGRWIRNPDQPNVLHAKWFGAKADGVTNDSAAITAAIAALGSEGGRLVLPYGICRANITVTASNITISGERKDEKGGSTNCYLAPFTIGDPVLTVGGDAVGQTTGGFRLENVFIRGADVGATGILFTGGTYDAAVIDCTIAGFATGVNIVSGTNAPTSVIRFVRCTLLSRSNAAAQAADRVFKCVNSLSWPTLYTTAIYISGCKINGATSGYTLENDSCEVGITDTYFDFTGSHGVLLTANGVTTPRLFMSGTTLDTTGGDLASIVLPDTSHPNSYINQSNSSAYYVKFSDGTRILWTGNASNGYPVSSYPNVRGSLQFQDASRADPNSYSSSKLVGGSGVAFNVVTADHTTDTFTGNFGLLNNDRVSFTTTGTLPANLVGRGYGYFVINKTDTTFQVSTTRGGSAFNFTSNGVGVLTAEYEFPSKAYASNGVAIVESLDGTRQIAANSGAHQFDGDSSSGYCYINLYDPVNNKTVSALIMNNGNLYLGPPGTGGDTYIQDRSGNNRIIIKGATGTLAATVKAVVGTSAEPDASAIFQVSGTTGGFLPPSMTSTQRDAIVSPANGLIIYNTTTGKHQGYNGAWNDFY